MIIMVVIIRMLLILVRYHSSAIAAHASGGLFVQSQLPCLLLLFNLRFLFFFRFSRFYGDTLGLIVLQVSYKLYRYSG